MISLGPLKEKSKIQQFFKDKGLEFNDKSGCVTAYCDNELLGYSLYYLDKTQMTVLYIEPINDLPFADGLLRSTLHVASERSVTNIYYTVEFEDLYTKLGFIKSQQEKTLNIDLLFGGCKGCKKDEISVYYGG